MRALVVARGEAGPVRFADVDEPVPSAGEALVEVRHIALNFGELNYLHLWPAGAVHGHDAAGVVVRAAADGSGPPVGARVALGMAPHAWAERVAVSPACLGTVPDGVELAEAAALGIAGVTALRVLRERSLLARNVLVTGASGGVGHFAVQLAALAGARVTALVGSPGRAAGLRELGADAVLTDPAELAGTEDRFDLVLHTVGGPLVAQAWSRLAEGGTIRLVGYSSGEATTFPPKALFGFGEPRTIATYGDRTSTSGELTDLLGLVAAGRLTVPVGLRGDGREVGDAVRALFARTVRGKVVLDVASGRGGERYEHVVCTPSPRPGRWLAGVDREGPMDVLAEVLRVVGCAGRARRRGGGRRDLGPGAGRRAWCGAARGLPGHGVAPHRGPAAAAGAGRGRRTRAARHRARNRRRRERDDGLLRPRGGGPGHR